MNEYNYSSFEYLKLCLMAEVIDSSQKKFTWDRIIRRYYRYPERRYIFWWRIASYLFKSCGKYRIKLANYINRKITYKWGTEIALDARIQPGITFSHHQGVVIAGISIIGKNFHIRQNTTIGIGDSRSFPSDLENKFIKIGDNVEVGANSCIIGVNLTIGSDVVIGAMSFINKDIPDNCICYTRKENATKIITRSRNK